MNNMRIQIKIFLILWLTLIGYVSKAQLVNNNDIYLTDGAVLYFNGDVVNSGKVTSLGALEIEGNVTNNDSIINNGTIDLTGDWINHGWHLSDSGKVILSGGNQTIGGSLPTSFYNLDLEGSGVKTMNIDAGVSSILDLNDRNLETETFRLSLTSGLPTCIERTSGYISNNFDGDVSINFSSSGEYNIPLGSLGYYRPLVVTNEHGGTNTIYAGLYFDSPEDHSYSITDKSSNVNTVFTDFFYKLSSDASIYYDITFHYDTLIDDAWDGLIQWSESEERWIKTSNVVSADNEFTYSVIIDLIDTIYTFATFETGNGNGEDTVTVNQLVIYNTFTPNEDGYNDFFYIENIDLFPHCKLVIYNRNGHQVYSKDGYNNEWDGKYFGNKLPAATYYYILDLGDGTQKLKGDVTIIR